MSGITSGSKRSSVNFSDDEVFAPWADGQANHGFIKSRLPAWYSSASTELRAALRKSQLFSLFSRRDLEPLRQKLPSVKAFAEPLLEKALIETFNLRLDLHTNDLVTVHSQTFFGMDKRRPFKQSLLQAALQNFEAFEAEDGGFEPGAALLPDDGLQLQLVAGTGVDGRYPRFRYRYFGIINIKPAQFAQMCRSLDLGARYQTHLDSVFRPAAVPGQSADELAAAVAAKFQRSEQDNVQVLAHIALMKNHISAPAYKMLLALTTQGSEPTWSGDPIRHGWLRLLDSVGEHGNTLYGALLIEPDKDDAASLPCVVYMPQEPEHPLKEYVSFKAFTDTLRRKLSTSTYQNYFQRFISLRESQRFFQRLNERLMPLRPIDGNPLSAGLRKRQFDAQAELSLEKFAYSPAPFQMLYEHLLVKTYEDSRVLAVPTDDEDQKSRMQRLQAYKSLGLDLLNMASFFIPVLGAAMAVIAVEQVMADIFVGVVDWKDGEVDEALTHLFGAAENIALAGAMIVAGSKASPSVASSPSAFFIENLIPVTLKNGQTRLWKADTAPFQQEVTLPNWVMANAEARVEVDGKNYLPLAGKLYQITFDVGLKKWRLQHTTNPQAYSPTLSHNNAGAWRHEGENPMGWDLHTLFKRLHPGLDDIDEQTIERILATTQTDVALLRQVHVENIKPPALLRDSILRFQIEDQINGFITAMNSGTPQDIRWPRIDPYLELLTVLPGWPEQRAVRLFDPEGGLLNVFGNHKGVLPSVELKYLPGQMGDVIASTLAALTPEEIETLLGEYNTTRQSQSSRLANQLADVAALRRNALLESMYQTDTYSDGVPVKLIKRDFPTLSTVIADELIESASARELAQMNASSRLPLRMAEQAREYQQQLRLNRANEGFYFKGADNPDTATAGFRLLPQLPGWPKHLALELRDGSLSGELLASIGDEFSALRWVLVKSGERYQTLDSGGNPIDSGDHSFFNALLQALPADTRAAIGLSSAARESELRLVLGALAVTQRDEVALALSMQKIKPGFTWPHRLADGRIGYPMSGRMRRLFSRLGQGSRNHSAELAVKSLFPGMGEAEVKAFVRELSTAHTGNPGDLPSFLQGKIRALETQYEQLESALGSWVSTPSAPRVRGDAVRFVVEADRRLAAMRIKNCWKRLSPKCYSERGRLLGYSLDLNFLAIGELPALTARFDHVHSLHVNNTGLDTETTNALLGYFSNLHELYLRGNDLTSIPEALSAHTALRQLSLRGNPLVLDQTSVNRLRGMLQLRTLNLNHCPIGPLLNVGRMRRLIRLNLRATGINALPAGLADCVNLIILDVRNNRIEDIPETVFHEEATTYRRLQLHDNPLSEATRERAQRLLSTDARRFMGISEDRPHAGAGLSPFSLWLPESSGRERTARLRIWNDLLAESESADFFRVLHDLAGTADYQGHRQGLTERVWAVLNAAATHGVLRDELFTLAAHPQTCGDGIMLVFNTLEIRALVFNVMTSARQNNEETELFELARGLERLDELEKIAREDIAIRSVDYPQLDEAEVRLAYRVGLAQRLQLPLQPQGMLYRSLAGVTDEAIDAAEQRVLHRERTSAFLRAVIARDFWMEYLEKHYAASFEPVQSPFHERLDDLDDRAYATLRTDEYLAQIELIRNERTAATQQLALKLTREVMARHTTAGADRRPGGAETLV